MRAICKAIAFSLAFTFCFCAVSSAEPVGRIESMKLLTTNTGWAATNKKLFWTTDGGAQWTDITPKLNHKRQMVSSVFFLDSSTGWVLLHCGDGRDVLADESCWALASTTDAGASWSVEHEKIAVPFSREYLQDSTGFSGRSWLDFVDARHGWEILDIATNSANPSAGEMLRTTDGGRTWEPTKDLPTSDHFLFTTITDGWMAGGKDQELFVTHDAGNSWQKVLLPTPPETSPNLGEVLTLPVFRNEKEGFISVQYSVGPAAGPYLTTLVLFSTGDAGKTWKQDRILSKLPGIFISETGGSFWVAAHSEPVEPLSGQARVQLYTEGSDRRVTKNIALVSSVGALTRLSFLGQERGWVDMFDKLLATEDSGNTWGDITPGSKHPASLPRKEGASADEAAWQPLQVASSPGSGNPVSTHLGFDAYNVPPATLSMSAWISSSPFYDIAIYLQGSKNGHKDPILGSSNGPAWVSAVEAQGWGIIPIWVGLQSPCACAKVNVTTGKCVAAYTSVFSSDPGSDGAEEADNAVSAAQSLGLSTPIIYKNIENYYGPLYARRPSKPPQVLPFKRTWMDGIPSFI